MSKFTVYAQPTGLIAIEVEAADPQAAIEAATAKPAAEWHTVSTDDGAEVDAESVERVTSGARTWFAAGMGLREV